jgi:hypothetical protein
MEKYNLSDEELYSKELSELKKICENLAFDNREECDYSLKEVVHSSSFLDQGFRDFTQNISELEKSLTQNKHIKSYEEEIRRLELQINAREINEKKYEEKILFENNKLLESCWDILKIKSYDAEKLFNLKLISKKQLETVFDRESKDLIEKNITEKKLKEKDIKRKKEFYVDYIRGRKVFKKDPESYISVKRQNKIREEAKKGCFIATSTMGNYHHPVVIDLRIFRDQWLLKRRWGISFTKWYYKHGPKAAKVIEKSIILKKLTYVLIVKPLQIITKNLR